MFSIIAATNLSIARADPFIVTAYFIFEPLLYLIFALLLWKVEQVDTEEISRYLFSDGIQISKSIVFDAEKPISPEQSRTFLKGMLKLLRRAVTSDTIFSYSCSASS